MLYVCISQSSCCRSVMNLTRGVGGKCPCPVCFVPQDEQSDLTKTHKPRTAIDTQQLCRLTSIQSTQAAREEILKSKGMRMLEVVIVLELHATGRPVDLMLTQSRTLSGLLNFPTRMQLLHSTTCTIMRMESVVNTFGRNFSDMSTIFVGKQ